MTQPGWYPDPQGGPDPRWFDGNQWTGLTNTPPPTKGGGRLRKTLITGACVFVFVAACSALVSGGDDTPKPAQVTSAAALPPVDASVPSPEPAGDAVAPAPMGQEVRDGKFSFVVLSVNTSKTAGDTSNQFETVTAQGKYVNVGLRVTNTGNEAQTFFASNQKLMVDGKEYSADGAAAMWTRSMSEEINPGNTVEFVVSFDVPNSVQTANFIELHDSAFSGGVSAALA